MIRKNLPLLSSFLIFDRKCSELGPPLITKAGFAPEFWHVSFKFYLHLSFLFYIFVCRRSAVIVFTFLKMFETHMFENFLWKSLAIIKLQAYTNSSLKNQLIQRYFWSICFRLKSHKTYFIENLWVAGSDVSRICFSFLFEFCK